MFEIGGWAVWAVASIFVLVRIFVMRDEASRGGSTHIGLLIQTTLMFLAVSLIPFFSMSKFHLLWIIPACWVGGFASFAVLPIPIVGTLIRVLALAFGYLIFLGIGANIVSVPGSK